VRRDHRYSASEALPPRTTPHARGSRLQNDLILPKSYGQGESDTRDAHRPYLHRSTQRRLNESPPRVDFDDLLLLAVRVFTRATTTRWRVAQPFQHVLVDEFQDRTSRQWELIGAGRGAHRQRIDGGGRRPIRCSRGRAPGIKMATDPQAIEERRARATEVWSCYGSGVFRGSSVLRVQQRASESEGVAVTLSSRPSGRVHSRAPCTSPGTSAAAPSAIHDLF